MTATTNGASLEDCLTNVFALIDLNGIRWKRFKQKEANDYIFTPLDTHPILTTYAKCIEENHIAVWRHEPQKRHYMSGGAGSGGGPGGTTSAVPSNFPTPSRTSNNNTPTSVGPNANLNANSGINSGGNQDFNSNNNNSNNLELWIFGYSNNFKVDDVIGSDLVEVEDDSWEQRGLSYECRTLLFKALHNLIDRCLIIKGFTRIGRWYVQPSAQTNSASCHNTNLLRKSLKQLKTQQLSSISQTSPSSKTSTSLSSSISSAIHNFIDYKRDGTPDLRQGLSKSEELRHTSSRSTSSYFTSSLDGTKSSLSFAFSFFGHGDSTICAAVDVRQHPLIHPLARSDLTAVQSGEIVRVALAPYGLNGILNGVNYKDSDNGAATTAFIQQWNKFCPLPKTMARLVPVNRFSPTGNSAMSAGNFNQKSQPSGPQQFNQSNNDSQSSRPCLSNLTNMLLPPTTKATLHFNHEPHEVPPVVEVIVAGHKMRYPSECVFTTTKIIDIYKSSNHTDFSARTNPHAAAKRPSTKTLASKPNKLSLLSEILSVDKTTGPNNSSEKDIADTAKSQQPKFTSPFNLPKSVQTKFSVAKTVSSETAIDQSPPKSSNPSATKNDINLVNGALDSQTIPVTSIAQSTATTPSIYSAFTSNLSSSTTLMPGELIKLFPTPPSLEQMIVSPSDDTTVTAKDLVPPSPRTNFEAPRDDGIDIYKPVECAIMPPPPKWAALSNIVVSNSVRLPPQCIYKGSLKSVISKDLLSSQSNLKDSIKWNGASTYTRSATPNMRQLSNLLEKSDCSYPTTPLTDQTNKKGFNMNPTTPKSLLSNNMLNSPAANSTMSIFSPSSSNISALNASTLVIPVPSAFTLPHQRLFNNLTEINSIQLNLLIHDSPLGAYLDHNFENCTLCVCNMSIKGSPPDALPRRVEIQNSWRSVTITDNMSSPSISNNEIFNECTCGFSAITNRHHSHLSGLFFEDELEITNVLYDPTEMIDQNKLFRNIRLSSYSETSLSEERKLVARVLSSPTGRRAKNPDEVSSILGQMKQEKSIRDEKASQQSTSALDETKLFVLEQLKQQCSTLIHPNSSLSKVLMVESFRNNRHLTSCVNYYAQATSSGSGSRGSFQKILDETNKYTQIRLVNRSPCSLKFSDFCESIKGIIIRMGNQQQQQNSRMAGSPIKPHSGSSSSNLVNILTRMLSPARHSLIGKSSIDNHGSSQIDVFAQGIQALVMPTLNIDPKGVLKTLEELVKDESKESLATLNRAILIFSSPVHDWQFLTTPVPESNFDVVNILKSLQPSIEEAVGSHNRSYKDFIHRQQQHIFSSRDSPTHEPVKPTPPCQGPLTWRQFHQASGRGTEDQCEPQPIPNLLTSYHVDKSHIAVSPFALKFWDKLLLEPYAPGHNIFYMALVPNDPNIVGQAKAFFEELGNTYEQMKLGKHIPIDKGLVLTSDSNLDGDVKNQTNEFDNWFASLEREGFDRLTSDVVKQLKSLAVKLDGNLIKTISEFIDLHRPNVDTHSDRFESSPPSHETPNNPQQPSFSGPFSSMLRGELSSDQKGSSSLKPAQQSSASEQGTNITYPHTSTTDVQTFIDPNTGLQTQIKSQILNKVKNDQGSGDHSYQEDEPYKQTGIVIYIVDPFSLPSLSRSQRSLAMIGLIKCYSLLHNQFPDNLKRITQLQLISLDSIISHSRPITDLSRVDQLRALSLNVYAQCRKILTNQITAKSLTGFGPAAALEAFFKTKNPDICLTKMFTPPFILAPLKDKQTELGEMFGDRREKSSVIFCSYCVTEDQRWLLATMTNDRGEMSDSTVININVPDRLRHSNVSVKRLALRRLMDFLISIMSEWANPWRIVIGKLGRVGHGELKEWANLMSKRSLLNYSRHLTERCRQCSVIPPSETVAILSACLVSLEPDSKLRVMPDQFATDDRQASFNKCPLSTPEDASVTHILVFPTSASIQPSLGNVEDPLVGSGLDDDLLNQFPLDDGMDDLGVGDNMDDLFSGAWDEPNTGHVNDHINLHHDNMTSSNHQQGLGSISGGDNADGIDEMLQLLQQPLALGYYISTAKVGQMPNWFWSTSPHLRNSCPVFLKSALHIHVPSVHSSDDLLQTGVGHSRKSHQLDSNLTTDVLRHVLEGYNSLSWLALNPKTYDRQSCLPVHMQNLLQLYHLIEAFS